MRQSVSPRVLFWTLATVASVATFSLLPAPMVLLSNQPTVYAQGSEIQTPAVTGSTTLEHLEIDSVVLGVYKAVGMSAGNLSWTLSGTDSENFRIDQEPDGQGTLAFIVAQDYESPEDSNRDRRYHVNIVASDATSTASLPVTVRLVNFNEGPEISGLAEVGYVEHETKPVARYTATDPEGDRVTWSLDMYGDDCLFRINQRGELFFKDPPDYDAPKDGEVPCGSGNGGLKGNEGEHHNNAYYVGVIATSPASDDAIEPSPREDALAVRVIVTEGNNPPEFSDDGRNHEVDENTPAGEDVGAPVLARDDHYDTLAYKLGGTDGSSFEIKSDTGQIRTKVALDYEMKSSYSVEVTATDPGGLSTTTDVTINVRDVDDEGNVMLSPKQPRLEQPLNANLFDQDDEVSVRGWNWEKATSPLDANWEPIVGATSTSYIPLQADLGHYIRASVDYTDKHGDHSAKADTDGPVRQRVQTPPPLIPTPTPTPSPTPTPTPNPPGGSGQPPVNEAPTLTGVESVQYPENGTESAATYTASDPENNRIIWTLSGPDRAVFSIIQGVLTFNAQPDYEDPTDSDVSNVYRVTVEASDSTNVATLSATVTVTDVNEPPQFPFGETTRSVPQSTSTGQNVGAPVEATDPERDALTYTITGTDAASFSIVASTGQLQMSVGLTLGSYTVTVSVSDGKGADGNADASTDDTIDVTINVVSADPPVGTSPTSALKSIPRQFVPINGGPRRILLSEYFSDSDDGFPPYQTASSDTSVATVKVSEGYLMITPVGTGVATTTLTVSDTPSIRDEFKVIVYRPVLPRTDTETVHIVDPEVDTRLTSSDGSMVVTLPDDAREQFYQVAIDALSNNCGRQAPIGERRLCVLVNLFDLDAQSIEESMNLPATLNVSLSQGQYEAVQTDISNGEFEMWRGQGPPDTSWNLIPECEDPRGSAECYSLTQTSDGGNLTVFNISNFSEFTAGIDVSTPPPAQAPTPVPTPPATNPTADGTGSGGGASQRSYDTFAYVGNESPQISGPYLVEFPENGSEPVASYTADDPEDDAVVWSLFGADRRKFEISENGILSFRAPPDFEDPAGLKGNTYWVIVQAEDDGRPSEYDVHNVYVAVTDVNELGGVSGDAEPSVPEAQLGAVAQYHVDDPEDGVITWSLTGPDASSFAIDQKGNLSPAAAFDYEAPNSLDYDNVHLLTITATDDGRPELSVTLDVAVTVVNVNEAPVVGDLPAVELTLRQESFVLNLGESFTDPDGDYLAYRISGQSITSVATAALEGDALWITPVGEGEISLHVVAADQGGLSAVGILTVLVTDLNPDPTPVPIVVDEPVSTEIEAPEEPTVLELSAESEKTDAFWPLSERLWSNVTQQPDGLPKVLVAFAIEPVDVPPKADVKLPPFITPTPLERAVPMEGAGSDQARAPLAPSGDFRDRGLAFWVLALLSLIALSIAGYTVRMLVIHRLQPLYVDLARLRRRLGKEAG